MNDYQPDLTLAHTDRFRVPNGYDTWVLTPRGFLYSVTAEIDITDGWPEYTPRDENLKFKITDCPPYVNMIQGEFEIAHLYGYHQGGIIFPRPLPNFNTARPYYLHIPANCPPIWIYTLNCLPKSVV